MPIESLTMTMLVSRTLSKGGRQQAYMADLDDRGDELYEEA